MTNEELEQALEHDLAQKQLAAEAERPVVVARWCLNNAAVAARAAECALVVVHPPAVAEAVSAARLAVTSLEQALVMLGALETENE